MKLYLKAKANKEHKYTPDCLLVENDDKSICFDIEGCTSAKNGLDCYTKGRITPWVMYEGDEEIDLCSIDSPKFTDEQIYKFIRNGKSYRICAWPFGDVDLKTNEELLFAEFSIGKGKLELDDCPPIEFEFDTEITW